MGRSGHGLHRSWRSIIRQTPVRLSRWARSTLSIFKRGGHENRAERNEWAYAHRSRFCLPEAKGSRAARRWRAARVPATAGPSNGRHRLRPSLPAHTLHVRDGKVISDLPLLECTVVPTTISQDWTWSIYMTNLTHSQVKNSSWVAIVTW